MKIYELRLDLYEDGPINLGTFSSREKAEEALEEDKLEWIHEDGSFGPNVIGYVIQEIDVK